MPVDFFYGYPFAVFFLFAIVGYLFLFIALSRYRRMMVQRFVFGLKQRSRACFWIQVLFLMVAWGAGVFALMDPKGNPQYPEGKKGNHQQEVEKSAVHRPKEVIFLLDDSASMAIKDTRTGRSRLDSGKEVIDQVVSQLEGEAVSLYTFTSQVNKRVPSTTDYIYLRLLLRNLEINEGETLGTDIHKAIKTLLEDYQGLSPQVYRYVIVLSDGGDTALYDLPKEESARAVNKMIEGVAFLKEEHWKIYTIGIGSANGAPVPDVVYQGKPVHSSLDPALLRALAVKGGGTYEELDTTIASKIASKLAKTINEDSPYLSPHERKAPLTSKESITVVYDSYYHYPLLIALLALMGALFFPDRIERNFLK